MRENWMFKLVGRENFTIGKHKCVITIESSTGFDYEFENNFARINPKYTKHGNSQ